MDDLGKQPLSPRASDNKRALLVAVIVLALALGFSVTAYRFLVGQVDAGTDVIASRASGGAADEDLPLLANYDAVVATAYGEEYSFTEIANARPLVINFWATWCPYCVQEMDDLQALYDEYADRVSFALVDCVDGTRETLDDGATWLNEKGITIPAYFDIEGDAQAKYGVVNLPTTVVANAEGEILTISPGVISVEKMREGLDSLLVD